MLLKPPPEDAQALYLASLGALGIDAAAHDVRFVEDNWESPVLGAWGLGWEVRRGHRRCRMRRLAHHPHPPHPTVPACAHVGVA